MRWFLAAAATVFVAAGLTAQPPDPPAPPGGPPGFPGNPGPDLNSWSRSFKELIPGLLDALKDTDQEVRQNSAMALAAMGQEVLKPLMEALADPIKEKRAAAAYALGQMGHSGQEAIPSLLKALKDEEYLVRRSASQALSRIISGEGVVYGFGGTGAMRGGFGGGFGASNPGRPFPGGAPSLPRGGFEPPRGGASPPPPPAPTPKPDKIKD